MGLGLDNQVAPSLSPNRWPSLAGLDSIDPTRLKATGMGIRPSQGPLPRPFMPSISKSPVTRVINVGKEGNVTHIWEEGELIEGSTEEYDCVDMHRYGDNLYEQSPSPLFFVFSRPLLSGGFLVLGGATKNEDLEPLRVVAVDGSECGLECLGAIIEAGEELREDGQRMEEA